MSGALDTPGPDAAYRGWQLYRERTQNSVKIAAKTTRNPRVIAVRLEHGFEYFRESCRCHAPGNTGFHLIGRPHPSIVFGKAPGWHLLTASLPLGD